MIEIHIIDLSRIFVGVLAPRGPKCTFCFNWYIV